MIPVARPYFDGNELANVEEAVKSTWVSSKGPFLDKFSKMFAEFCTVKYASTASNGTTALHLALLATDLKAGDEVIIPDLTFAASANALLYLNVKPVLIDVEKDTACINANEIEKKITKKTKAIMPVHLYGHPCNMEEIMKLANDHKLLVIEDAAESHGAEVNKKRVGSFGHVGCFSFYGNKIITTGEGGMCVTNDQTLYERMELLKNHGMSEKKRYWHDIIGYNYRLTNLQAALGVAQMKKIDFLVNDKIRVAKSYSKRLIHLEKKGLINLPVCKDWAKNVYWLYNITLKNSSVSRDELIKKLGEKGIETRPFFYPLHIMPPYKANEIFPVSDWLSINGLSIPSYVGLDEKDIDYICNCIEQILC